jgi:hypothetical protein
MPLSLTNFYAARRHPGFRGRFLWENIQMPHAIAPYPPSLPPLVDRFAVARAAHRLVVHWPLAQMPRAMQRPKRPHQQLLFYPTPVAVSEYQGRMLDLG